MRFAFEGLEKSVQNCVDISYSFGDGKYTKKTILKSQQKKKENSCLYK